MDEEKVLNAIKYRLSQIGCEFEGITQSQVKQLMKIELELSKRLSIQENASALIRDNKINIASIANAVGITRKTIYNNDVLKDCIESAGKQYDSNYPISGLSSIREQLNESKEIINKMVRRDVDIENMKAEIDMLQKEIQDYKSQVKSLSEENASLAGKLKDAEKRKSVKASLKLL